ncbi:MAG: PTS transporter subunit EIIA [Planctomycetes bacterium]|nr:PTS transporter subunit EIIA [Planctomycetota bacterium]
MDGNVPSHLMDSHRVLLTMAAAIAGGVMLIVIARRLNLPGIVLLLLGGIIMGPEVLGWVDPHGLGGGLRVVVAMSVGLILFEGGLTLDVDGYRTAPAMIKRLLTVGVVITWLGTAAALHLVLGLALPYAIVSASLVIVTGPTVIAPMLKRLRVNPKLHGILHWEGVLIDPIGVLIAVLCFEWIIGEKGSTGALVSLMLRVVAGLGIGVIGGLLIGFLVRRKVVGDETVNVFALGGAVLVFGLAELIQAEAGLLAVTAAGFIFAGSGAARVRDVRRFKGEITDLLIGTLFILLAARLDLEQFRTFGLGGAAVVAIVMVVIRPVSIIICSWGLDLSGREKALLSWVAPRGIVAASMASLIAIEMERAGEGDIGRFVESFTYSVIIATIVIQGLTAGPLVRLLGLERPQLRGWMIVGAHALGRRLASFLRRSANVPVVLVDSNNRAVHEARRDGAVAVAGDARDTALQDRVELQGVGNVLALTDNDDLNVRLCQIWGEIVGSERVFRCRASDVPHREDDDEIAGHLVWPDLPKPSLVSAELSRLEATTREGAGDAAALRRFATPIATVTESGGLRLDVDQLGPDDPRPSGPTLFLRRTADYLRRTLRAELIGPSSATDLRSLFEELVTRAIALQPDLPRDSVVLDLLEREAAAPTAIGHGIAIPHAYCRQLDTRLCAVARLDEEVPFETPDGEPVRIVLMILSPQGDPEGHLATLAEIARILSDAETRAALADARSPAVIMRLLHAG